MKTLSHIAIILMLSLWTTLSPANASDEEESSPQTSQPTFKDASFDTSEKLEKRIEALEKALLYLLPPSINSEADFLRLTFSRRLQSHLTGFFGAYKVLSSNKIARAEPDFMLGVTLIQTALSFSPEPFVGGSINALIEIGNIIYGTRVQAKDQKFYHIFSSFNEIDKASYYIADGIAGIYAPQIQCLTPKGAEDLADSAGETLKYYVELHRGKIITPNNLALAVGQYCKNSHGSGLVHARCKKIEHRLADKTIEWYDVDIFLGSGIKANEKCYKNNKESYYFIKDGMNRVYTQAPTNIKKYGYRNTTEEYVNQLGFQLIDTRPSSALTVSSPTSLQVADNKVAANEEEKNE